MTATRPSRFNIHRDLSRPVVTPHPPSNEQYWEIARHDICRVSRYAHHRGVAAWLSRAVSELGVWVCEAILVIARWKAVDGTEMETEVPGLCVLDRVSVVVQMGASRAFVDPSLTSFFRARRRSVTFLYLADGCSPAAKYRNHSSSMPTWPTLARHQSGNDYIDIAMLVSSFRIRTLPSLCSCHLPTAMHAVLSLYYYPRKHSSLPGHGRIGQVGTPFKRWAPTRPKRAGHRSDQPACAGSSTLR